MEGARKKQVPVCRCPYCDTDFQGDSMLLSHWETDPRCKAVNKRRIVDTMKFYANEGVFRRWKKGIVKLWKKTMQRRPRVFFDVTIAGQPAGRIILYNVDVPKSAESFRALCTGERGSALHYKGCLFNSVIPGIMCQVGKLTRDDGSGDGTEFPQENFAREHKKCTVSLMSTGKNVNGSPFAISFVPSPWLDKKWVVIGRVVKSFDTLKLIDSQGTLSGSTKKEVRVAECGKLK